MSAKSTKSRKALNRPFAADVMKRARAIAEGYQIVLQFEDGEWYGRGLEMPFVMSDGQTAEACVRSTREALALAVATTLESGKAPLPAASERKRSEQINIRVTPEEKLLLEAAARRRGFRGLGEYVRSASLEERN
jgi:predicted RNase H-like HicB family nuclease